VRSLQFNLAHKSPPKKTKNVSNGTKNITFLKKIKKQTVMREIKRPEMKKVKKEITIPETRNNLNKEKP